MRLAYWRAPFIGRLCIVTTVSNPDMGVRGVIWGKHGSWLLLKQASLVRAGADPVAVDNDIVIHLHNVAFVQIASGSK